MQDDCAHDTAEQAVADFLHRTQWSIRALLRERGLTQADLASLLDVTEGRISQLFSARANLTLETVARVFHALGELPEITSPGLQATYRRQSTKRYSPRLEFASCYTAEDTSTAWSQQGQLCLLIPEEPGPSYVVEAANGGEEIGIGHRHVA